MNSRGTNGSSAGGNTESVGQRMDNIGESAQQFVSEARGAVTDFSEALDLKGRVDRNPYLTLAAAAGVGYILGGGLFTPLTARMVRLGVKLAALPFVKDELLGMAEAAVDQIAGGRSPRAGGSQPQSANYPSQGGFAGQKTPGSGGQGGSSAV